MINNILCYYCLKEDIKFKKVNEGNVRVMKKFSYSFILFLVVNQENMQFIEIQFLKENWRFLLVFKEYVEILCFKRKQFLSIFNNDNFLYLDGVYIRY